jgi:hypothetical protein
VVRVSAADSEVPGSIPGLPDLLSSSGSPTVYTQTRQELLERKVAALV